jgi:hypothetical protein
MTTPARIRQLATEHYGWQPGDELTDVAIKSLSSRSGVRPGKVREALASAGRRGRRSAGPLKVISIRMRADREPIALRLAHQAGHQTITAWVQGLVEMEIREATKGE